MCCDCVYVPLYGDSWKALLEAIDALAGPATDVLISLERRHVKDGDDGVDPFLDGMRAAQRLRADVVPGGDARRGVPLPARAVSTTASAGGLCFVLT